MLNKEQLIELLRDHGTETVADTPWRKEEEGGFDHEGYKVRHVLRHGGHEGAGEEHFVVFSVEDSNGNKEYWEIPGWYQSHYGSELEVDGLFQVKPVEVTVVQYHPVK
jgi:hypothetical protein